MNEIKLSVIMPVYNSAIYIKQTINSILNQTFTDFELIILDDFSTDESIEIIKQYDDKRIILIENKIKQGHIKLLNIGIDLSRGLFIARMDSDDICLPTRFEDQINIFIKDPLVSIVFSKSYIIDNQNNFICESWRPRKLKMILRFLPHKNFIPHPSIMIKKDVLIKNGKYDTKSKLNEDLNLWYRLFKNGEKFYYIKKILLLYRINPKSVQNIIGNESYDKNYYYRIIKECFSNNKKITAIELTIKYWDKLNFKQVLIINLKMMIPFYLILIKSYSASVYNRLLNK
jgi:glycosyltransferase involved in cell wall biosynthesis